MNKGSMKKQVYGRKLTKNDRWLSRLGYVNSGTIILLRCVFTVTSFLRADKRFRDGISKKEKKKHIHYLLENND